MWDFLNNTSMKFISKKNKGIKIKFYLENIEKHKEQNLLPSITFLLFNL